MPPLLHAARMHAHTSPCTPHACPHLPLQPARTHVHNSQHPACSRPAGRGICERRFPAGPAESLLPQQPLCLGRADACARFVPPALPDAHGDPRPVHVARNAASNGGGGAAGGSRSGRRPRAARAARPARLRPLLLGGVGQRRMPGTGGPGAATAWALEPRLLGPKSFECLCALASSAWARLPRVLGR
eukprot:58568-Chlamydomonas_euryale.AAC.1